MLRTQKGSHQKKVQGPNLEINCNKRVCIKDIWKLLFNFIREGRFSHTICNLLCSCFISEGLTGAYNSMVQVVINPVKYHS